MGRKKVAMGKVNTFVFARSRIIVKTNHCTNDCFKFVKLLSWLICQMSDANLKEN